MLVRFFLLSCLLLILTGCNKNDSSLVVERPTESMVPPNAPAIPLTAAPFLTQPIATTIIESPNEALPIWRSFAKNRPFLVIAANTPALLPLPAELTDQVRQLLQSADNTELLRRSSPSEPDPLLLPEMSLGAALDAGWFSGVIWIFPTPRSPKELDLKIFQQQLVEARIASNEEVKSFSLQNGSFSGIVRGRPFFAASLDVLPDLEPSALLHVDANYFKPLYKGEIKSPLYPLISKLLKKIQEKGWKIAAATVSLSNQTGELPLRTRFIGKDLAAILRNPQMLTKPFPKQWQERSNALYLENFMKTEEIHNIYLQMEQADSSDPAVKFGLYDLARQMKQPEAALGYLRQAVKIDPAYALEYLALSQVALEKKRLDKAIEMLKLARDALPQNPFIPMQLAHILIATDQKDEAKIVLDQLIAIEWSKTYYPEQIKIVKKLEDQQRK